MQAIQSVKVGGHALHAADPEAEEGMRREADESGEAQQSGRQLNSEIRRVGGPGWSSVWPRSAAPAVPEARRNRRPDHRRSHIPGRAMRGAKFSFGKT